MWELYSGEALYEGMTVGQVLYAVVYDAKRPPILEGCPPEYAALMRDCWKSEPTKRCAPSWLRKPYTNSSHPVQRASECATRAQAPICCRGPFAEGCRCISMLLVCASVAHSCSRCMDLYVSEKTADFLGSLSFYHFDLRRPDFEEVLARLQPLHDELRSRRRTNNSLATASAPGVSRSLAMGLLPRTRSSDLRDGQAADASVKP